MDINQLKVGMKIRICKDPSISIEKYSGGIAKRRMAGKIKTVYSIFVNSILVEDKHCHWTIHIDDLREVAPLSSIKPQIFDPNQLVIE